MSDEPARAGGVDLASFDNFLNEPAMHEQIIGSFCHDLRQPLQTALMRIAALKRADADGQNGELLEDLYLSLREIATMSETVFDTIRLSRATIASQAKAVALDQTLQRIAGDFRALAAQHRLRLRVRATPFVVVTDETLVMRIISNLVQNALHYTRKGGVLVAPRLRHGQLCIEVWDTGPGIDAEHLERIFQAFTRGTNELESSTAASCTGLGLWNAREFARLMGGSITVQSRVDRGTVFRLTIPGEVERRVVARPRSTGRNKQAGGPVLLIGADAAPLLELQRLVLRAGLTHVSFREAIELLSYLNVGLNHPQLLLMDMEIGSIDVDFLFGILQSRFADLPCAVLAADFAHPRVAALRLQGITVIEKPLTVARLQQLVTGTPAAEVAPAAAPGRRRRVRRDTDGASGSSTT